MGKTERTLPKEIERFHQLAARCRHVEHEGETFDLTVEGAEVDPDAVVLELKLTAADCRAMLLADETLSRFRQVQIARSQKKSPKKAAAVAKNGLLGGRPVGSGKKKRDPEAGG